MESNVTIESTAPLEPVAAVRPDLELEQERPVEDGVFLVFRDWDGRVRHVALSKPVTLIGRSLSADVRFEDANVSRRHARVVRDQDGGLRVLNESSNGTLVNGEPCEDRSLVDGDIISVAHYQLHVADNIRAAVRRREREAAPI